MLLFQGLVFVKSIEPLWSVLPLCMYAHQSPFLSSCGRISCILGTFFRNPLSSELLMTRLWQTSYCPHISRDTKETFFSSNLSHAPKTAHMRLSWSIPHTWIQVFPAAWAIFCSLLLELYSDHQRNIPYTCFFPVKSTIQYTLCSRGCRRGDTRWGP